MFPETAGKPLEEIEEMFTNNGPGSKKYIGTLAWKTSTYNGERMTFDEEKLGPRVSHGSGSPTVETLPQTDKTV